MVSNIFWNFHPKTLVKMNQPILTIFFFSNWVGFKPPPASCFESTGFFPCPKAAVLVFQASTLSGNLLIEDISRYVQIFNDISWMALKGAGLPELQDLKRKPMGHLEHFDWFPMCVVFFALL